MSDSRGSKNAFICPNYMNNLMDTNIKILAIALVAISIGVAPSLVINKSVDAASHYCADEMGKSSDG